VTGWTFHLPLLDTIPIEIGGNVFPIDPAGAGAGYARLAIVCDFIDDYFTARAIAFLTWLVDLEISFSITCQTYRFPTGWKLKVSHSFTDLAVIPLFDRKPISIAFAADVSFRHSFGHAVFSLLKSGRRNNAPRLNIFALL
jgi:hypothetical protein